MRIRYLLLNAYGGGGTIRTTLSMAGLLAERGHDIEVASVTQRRPRSVFPVPPGVRLVSLTSPFHPARGLSRAALAGTTSRFAHPNDRLGARLTRAHDRALRRYVAAQDDCIVVGTRISLNLALAHLRTDRQVAIAQEHNHLAKAAAVRASYTEHYPRLDAVVVLTEGDAASYRTLLGNSCRVDVVPNALPQGTPCAGRPCAAPWRSRRDLSSDARASTSSSTRGARSRPRTPTGGCGSSAPARRPHPWPHRSSPPA